MFQACELKLMWLSCTAYRIILKEVLACSQGTWVQRKVQIHYYHALKEQAKVKITVNPKHVYSRGDTWQLMQPLVPFSICHPHPSFAFLHQLPPSTPQSCVCAGFVFMTTPVIRRHCRAAGVNTAEVHYTDCCSCLLPGSRLCLQSGVFLC